jgi:hypothetical protein
MRKAPERLAGLQTPEGSPIPPNTLAALKREMQHLGFINEQIKQIEDERGAGHSINRAVTPSTRLPTQARRRATGQARDASKQPADPTICKTSQPQRE